MERVRFSSIIDHISVPHIEDALETLRGVGNTVYGVLTGRRQTAQYVLDTWLDTVEQGEIPDRDIEEITTILIRIAMEEVIEKGQFERLKMLLRIKDREMKEMGFNDDIYQSIKLLVRHEERLGKTDTLLLSIREIVLQNIYPFLLRTGSIDSLLCSDSFSDTDRALFRYLLKGEGDPYYLYGLLKNSIELHYKTNRVPLEIHDEMYMLEKHIEIIAEKRKKYNTHIRISSQKVKDLSRIE